MRRNMRHPSPSFHLPFFPFSPLFFPFNAWLCWLAGAGAFRGQIQYVCLLNAVHIGAREGGPDIDPKGASGDQIMHPSNSTSTRRTFALVDCTIVPCEAVIISLRMRSIMSQSYLDVRRLFRP